MRKLSKTNNMSVVTLFAITLCRYEERFTCSMKKLIKMNFEDDTKEISVSKFKCRAVNTEGQGGSSVPPPFFGRLVNPIPTKGWGRLCPSNYFNFQTFLGP